MFGKRSANSAKPRAPQGPSSTVVEAIAPAAPAAQPMALAPAAPAEVRRSDEYYQTKSTIFGALIEAIDLSQLSKLDAESAREENSRHRQ